MYIIFFQKKIEIRQTNFQTRFAEAAARRASADARQHSDSDVIGTRVYVVDVDVARDRSRRDRFVAERRSDALVAT